MVVPSPQRLVSALTGVALVALVVGPTPGLAQTQVAAGSMPPVAAPPPFVDESYTLGPGDRVRIEVFKLPQYSGENQVLADGNLNLIQVGAVPVQGLTIAEATQAISRQYSRLLRYPVITVSLLAPRPIKVGVSGEVNRPGSYTIPTDAGSQLPTVTKALQLAGGITQSADVRRIQIVRPRANGAAQVIDVDLWEFLKTGDLQRDVALRAGDAIRVPPNPTPNLAEAPQLAVASFAADRNQSLNIAVVGEVYRPGPQTVVANARTTQAGQLGNVGGPGDSDRPPTVSRAIQVAGGIKPMADIRHVQVRRVTKAGTEQTIDVNLWQLLKTGDLSQDVILQDRDTVIIPTAKNVTPGEATELASATFSPDTIKINVAGEVNRPGLVEVRPNTPLNQALMAAGGFNNRANRGSVDLIRLNPDGTVTRRNIRIDFSKGIDDKDNPAMRNDDVIVVARSGFTKFSDSVGTVLSPIGNVLGILGVFNLFR